MSTEVSLDALWEQMVVFGTNAFLVTVGADGRPHAVSATVAAGDGRITASPGATSRGNAAERPAVMLLWPAPDGGPYSLLVDGDATVQADDTLEIAPTSAVLHRVAGADTELASCVRLLRAP